MSDWQVGDLAVCIFCDPGPQVDPWKPVIGCVYTVAGVLDWGAQGFGLELEEDTAAFTPESTWEAEWFRKIRPDEQEACEPEFVTLLKRSKQRVSA